MTSWSSALLVMPTNLYHSWFMLTKSMLLLSLCWCSRRSDRYFFRYLRPRESFTGSADVVSAQDLELRICDFSHCCTRRFYLWSSISIAAIWSAGVLLLVLLLRGVGSLNGSTRPLYVLRRSSIRRGFSKFKPR